MKQGLNCVISKNANLQEDLILGHNVIIEDNVTIGKTYILIAIQ